MVDVTSFLLRWLYLSKLVQDVAEMQTLPYQPSQVPGSQPQATVHNPIQPPPPGAQTTTVAMPPSKKEEEQAWKDHCLRGILSYPPGTQRLYALDSLRLELVQQLAHHLRSSDHSIKRYSMYCHRKENAIDISSVIDEDPYLDADLEIVRAFEAATSVKDVEATDDDAETAMTTTSTEDGSNEAVLVISEEGANVMESESTESSGDEASFIEENEADVPSEEVLEHAYESLANFRDYLPQLVSAVLMSPGALQPNLLDPVQKFRRLLLTRCLQDANWGIELCWLLEAEVGRAWKTLFEHRQQTGRRLIIVLPAEKAAVLAKIGTAKRAAFELLQDAEQATAYGYTFPPQNLDGSKLPLVDPDLEPSPARLPSSLSLRRCSHFGDTMHFIDRLTQISLDLRLVPTIQRQVSDVYAWRFSDMLVTTTF